MSRFRAAMVLLCLLALLFVALETSQGPKVVCRDTGSEAGACAGPPASEAGAKNRSGASSQE